LASGLRVYDGWFLLLLRADRHSGEVGLSTGAWNKSRVKALVPLDLKVKPERTTSAPIRWYATSTLVTPKT
jgi:hypothetical protein